MLCPEKAINGHTGEKSSQGSPNQQTSPATWRVPGLQIART